MWGCSQSGEISYVSPAARWSPPREQRPRRPRRGRRREWGRRLPCCRSSPPGCPGTGGRAGPCWALAGTFLLCSSCWWCPSPGSTCPRWPGWARSRSSSWRWGSPWSRRTRSSTCSSPRWRLGRPWCRTSSGWRGRHSRGRPWCWRGEESRRSCVSPGHRGHTRRYTGTRQPSLPSCRGLQQRETC